MLEKLETIDWHNLQHAYGAASDIPANIRALASPHREVRKQALWILYGNIFHQGTRYEASPYAIPFLYELVENEEVEDRHKIIYYIVQLALGYESSYLQEGINPRQIKAELRQAHEGMSEQEIQNSKEYGYSYLALLDCYCFAEDGVPILQEIILKTPKDEKIENLALVNAAVYALGWFAEKGTSSAELIKSQIPLLKDEEDIANCILSIGLLAKNTIPQIDMTFLKDYLHSSSPLLKTSAAIALAEMPLTDTIIDILITAITSNEELRDVDVRFNKGDLNGYASGILTRYAQTKEEEQKILLALSKALAELNMYQATSTTSFVLEILNKDREIPIKETKLKDLEENEIIALKAIANSNGWGENGVSFGNFKLLLRDAGLPDAKKEFLEFLEE
ncbi:hypothetical protein [Bernardetia sp.]|uniref:hypothetical protein n=1 Tax=Bernardetia sp. TaxID=1937974 RepID=UPI0025C09FF1|nr:hypothetical protein [Bernardetia sp.]